MNKKSSELRSLSRRISGVTMPIQRKRMKWQRNWLCLCDSGRKYKNCCMKDIDELTSSDGNASVDPLSPAIKDIVEAHCKLDGNGGLKKNG